LILAQRRFFGLAHLIDARSWRRVYGFAISLVLCCALPFGKGQKPLRAQGKIRLLGIGLRKDRHQRTGRTIGMKNGPDPIGHAGLIQHRISTCSTDSTARSFRNFRGTNLRPRRWLRPKWQNSPKPEKPARRIAGRTAATASMQKASISASLPKPITKVNGPKGIPIFMLQGVTHFITRCKWQSRISDARDRAAPCRP